MSHSHSGIKIDKFLFKNDIKHNDNLYKNYYLKNRIFHWILNITNYKQFKDLGNPDEVGNYARRIIIIFFKKL